MTFLFDNETIQRIHDYNVALEAEEKGLRQGMQRGQEKGISAMVSTLQGLSIDRATVIQSLIREFDLLPQTAEEKVSQYWVQ